MSDLRGFEHPQQESGVMKKIGAAIVVVLAVGAAGIYVHDHKLWHGSPRQIVPDQDLPSPGPPSR